ncbi:DNA methyltransferase 1-associated protein DMAP1 [Paecilomyces variotii No. 5]|uniref:SWR1-complex protein 4 n=1 Tax=Byssochlamys spectabilis (strain No. 5 / NBRC 109023) TaxID=1356009 RepID=V5FX80_BYSSN|nr:DNA methyltransferase 1-associated protein DMAP1 [Paecilomyces variotii No. 5]
MAAADVRDMLDLPADGQHPRPHKKQKVVEKRPEGITRELFALLGERAPPIAINENRYKGRPKWMSKTKVRPWRMTPFTNVARSDDLVLRHWQRQTDIPSQAPAPDGNEMEVDEKKEERSGAVDGSVYPFAKYNIKAQVPKRYTDEQYNRHLKSDDWSREETDYLMDLVEEYDLRWVVIADRYDYQPRGTDTGSEGNATALVTAQRYRSMEHMKARYYTVAANMLALEHPPSEMSEAEFDLHEKMMKFDPERERARKDLAALQLNRSADEVREEAILLEELKRITANEQQFIAERRELYSRLEVPISVGNTTMYQSSQGLSQLLQMLLQADKSKKRRSILGPEAAAASPAAQTPAGNAPSSARDSRADTPTGPTAPTNKKSAAAAAAAASKEVQQTVKTLTPAEEARYGVQHHDRLTAGVQFRSDRAQKLTQAKSNIQTQKLAAALNELEVPLRLVMPTERVCKEFERLIHSVNLLLDARKVSEKIESEIRVIEAAKAEKERKEREARGETEKDQEKETEVKTEQDDQPTGPIPQGGDATATTNDPTSVPATSTETSKPNSNGQEPSSNASAEGQKDAPATAGTADGENANGDKDKDGSAAHKRSASVLSSVSDKSTKRQKK